MALTLDATVGGAAANSYLTLAQAAAYFDARLHADAWEAADPVDRERSLVQATRRLDRLPWVGRATTTTQRLAWPRSGVRTPEGVLHATDTLPTVLQEATAELALALLAAGTTDPVADDPLAGLTSVSLGPLSFSKSATPASDADLPVVVRRLLAPYAAAGGGTVRLVRS